MAALHGIVFAVLIFNGAVKVSKRLRRNREPIEWARCEVILVSCFLNAWHSWATSSHFASTFSDADELDVAFRKFTTEMVMNGSLTKHYNSCSYMTAEIRSTPSVWMVSPKLSAAALHQFDLRKELRLLFYW